MKLKIRKSLDFETRPSYILHLRATDGAVSNKLSAEATVSIGVNDVQDQAPVFQNTPYSTNVAENSPEVKPKNNFKQFIVNNIPFILGFISTYNYSDRW